MRKPSKRGQVATEYLIILAVVVIISLIVVGVLRSFTTVRTGFEVAKAKIEWSSQPVSLVAATLYANGSGVMLITNNEQYPIKITSVGMGKAPVAQLNPITVYTGSSEFVWLAPDSFVPGAADTEYNLDVEIKYAHASEPALISTASGKISGVYE